MATNVTRSAFDKRRKAADAAKHHSNVLTWQPEPPTPPAPKPQRQRVPKFRVGMVRAVAGELLDVRRVTYANGSYSYFVVRVATGKWREFTEVELAMITGGLAA